MPEDRYVWVLYYSDLLAENFKNDTICGVFDGAEKAQSAVFRRREQQWEGSDEQGYRCAMGNHSYYHISRFTMNEWKD